MGYQVEKSFATNFPTETRVPTMATKVDIFEDYKDDFVSDENENTYSMSKNGELHLKIFFNITTMNKDNPQDRKVRHFSNHFL